MDQNSFKNITLAAPTTTTVHTGEGTLHAVTVNKAVATGVITIYDGTAATGTKIATITSPGTLLQNNFTLIYDVDFRVSLTIVTSTAAQDITISYR